MRRLAVLMLSIASFLPACSIEDGSSAQMLENQYWSALDGWVESGGIVDDVQNAVVENCGKLVMVMAGGKEKAALATTDREEFHFRVDVCTKMTVNRVYPQPEFENPDTISKICKESTTAIFKTLCSRSGFM